MSKAFYLSKTFWLALITFVGSFIPAVRDYVFANPSTFATIWSLAVVVLRLISKDKIVLVE